jgi:hypothetical protein
MHKAISAAGVTLAAAILAPSASASVFASVPGVQQGKKATLKVSVKTSSKGKVSCTAYVPATSGKAPSPLKKLASKTVSKGKVKFTWTVSKSAPTGTWPVVVACGSAGSDDTTLQVKAAPPKNGSRSKPLALGESYTRDGWRVSLVSSIPDATALVLAENQFNDPPEAGRQFYITRVRATRTAAATDRFDAGFRLRAVGASNVGYTTFQDNCGVIPGAFPDSTDVFSGGTVEGNICVSVRSSDVASLLFYDDGLASEPDLFLKPV